MALIFMDGWDKYGGANTNSTAVSALLAGEWNTITNVNIAAPLSSTGQAVTAAGTGMTLTKTLPSAVGRIIGGIRFSATLANTCGIQFLDGASNQMGIGIATTGIISLRNGNVTSGTILGSSSAVSANTTHYLEWDITLGNSAAYAVYLDGVSVISGTGDTTATTNNTVSGVTFTCTSAPTVTWDDFYLFDTTSGTNNAVLLTSPRIETTLPTSDSAVQFSIGAAVLGGTISRTTSAVATAANYWYVRPFTPPRSCTLNSISLVPNGTNGTVNLRPMIYSDSAGLPGTLLSGGSTVVGTTTATTLTMPLTSAQSLSAGTQYWLGFMQDTNVSMVGYDGGTNGRSGTATFTSGAPSTPPTQAAASNILLWGNVTSTGANYYEVSQSPPPAANTSYVTDTTVGHEDLYGFPALSVVPASVYVVAVKAFCERSDSGARTVSLRVSSGGTDSGGSSTGQTPGTSYAWIGSHFATDPNGSIAWTGTALNAATAGFKIDA